MRSFEVVDAPGAQGCSSASSYMEVYDTRGTLMGSFMFGDLTIWGLYSWSPIFVNSHIYIYIICMMCMKIHRR